MKNDLIILITGFPAEDFFKKTILCCHGNKTYYFNAFSACWQTLALCVIIIEQIFYCHFLNLNGASGSSVSIIV